MQRKPTAILTSDIHLREDTPICRTDDALKTLQRKLEWLRELQHKCGDVPILDAGDVFHQWKPSPALLTFAIRHLPKPFYTVPGNHDIPQHSMALLEKSGLNTLRTGNHVGVLGSIPLEQYSDFVAWGAPWGGLESSRHRRFDGVWKKREVLLYHGLVYDDVPPWPGAEKEGSSGDAFLKKVSGLDLIVSGHYHRSFVAQREGRLLVNPGGIMRMTADEADRQPQVYVWYAEDNSVEAVPVPIEKGVVVADHLVQQKEKDQRMEAFLSRLGDGSIELGLSFRENLSRYMTQNQVRQGVQDVVWGSLERRG
jgi:DNA repair exonuclease SbcCD nuclease subunit